MFYPGQKVEYVGNSIDIFGRPMRVAHGVPYTVTHVFNSWNNECLLLAEVDPGAACGWVAKNFRPLIIRKTDISIFTAMLNPATRPKLIPAG